MARQSTKAKEPALTEASAEKTQDAIQLLMADHREVEALFKEFQNSKNDDDEKAHIVEKICEALGAHAEIEEEIFYPAARDALGEKGENMLDEAEVEHASIKSLVEQLQDAEPDAHLYDAKVKVLCEYVAHHVKEEEDEMFPKVKKTKLDLDKLGGELLARKTELLGSADDDEEDAG